MLNTQILNLQPPYQLIAAGGMMGMQVATLIVVDSREDAEGHYAITTHSHPIVNYARKCEALDPKNPARYAARRRPADYLRPEGAVWDKVEVKDIRVLGIEGAMQKLQWDQFLSIMNEASDADFGRRLSAELDLAALRHQMSALYASATALGAPLARLKADCASVAIVVCDDPLLFGPQPFLSVDLFEQPLFTVAMGEADATAHLLAEGIKIFAEYLLQPGAAIGLNLIDDKPEGAEPYIALFDRVDELLRGYCPTGKII